MLIVIDCYCLVLIITDYYILFDDYAAHVAQHRHIPLSIDYYWLFLITTVYFLYYRLLHIVTNCVRMIADYYRFLLLFIYDYRRLLICMQYYWLLQIIYWLLLFIIDCYCFLLIITTYYRLLDDYTAHVAQHPRIPPFIDYYLLLLIATVYYWLL